MDALKAEIAAKKRKALAARESSEEVRGDSGGSGSKYRRRGDEDSDGQQRQETAAAAKRSDSSAQGRLAQLEEGGVSDAVAPLDSTQRASKSPAPATRTLTPSDPQHEVFNVSNAECVRRLRSKGEPVRLFGESDKERRLRLRALELIEERGEKMGQNDFMRALRGAESSMLSHELDARAGAEKDGKMSTSKEGKGDAAEASEQSEKREGVGMDSVLDLGLIKRDINKVYPIIYYTLKGLMRDWEQMLAERAIEIRQSNQGKLVAATQAQTAEYLKPLFKQLRHRSVKPDVLSRLAEIVHHVQKREYRHANDSYLQLSIGNAPWPIGVTMVGIHERSGREKINSSNVAHVLNDEVSRKYIQSLKRLMTFAQTKYPPKDVSMLMG